jgi:hypothetical protein
MKRHRILAFHTSLQDLSRLDIASGLPQRSHEQSAHMSRRAVLSAVSSLLPVLPVLASDEPNIEVFMDADFSGWSFRSQSSKAEVPRLATMTSFRLKAGLSVIFYKNINFEIELSDAPARITRVTTAARSSPNTTTKWIHFDFLVTVPFKTNCLNTGFRVRSYLDDGTACKLPLSIGS